MSPTRLLNSYMAGCQNRGASSYNKRGHFIENITKHSKTMGVTIKRCPLRSKPNTWLIEFKHSYLFYSIVELHIFGVAIKESSICLFFLSLPLLTMSLIVWTEFRECKPTYVLSVARTMPETMPRTMPARGIFIPCLTNYQLSLLMVIVVDRVWTPGPS